MTPKPAVILAFRRASRAELSATAPEVVPTIQIDNGDDIEADIAEACGDVDLAYHMGYVRAIEAGYRKSRKRGRAAILATIKEVHKGAYEAGLGDSRIAR